MTITCQPAAGILQQNQYVYGRFVPVPAQLSVVDVLTDPIVCIGESNPGPSAEPYCVFTILT